MQRVLYPLRSTLAQAVRIKSAVVAGGSREFDDAAIPLTVAVREALDDVLAHDFSSFFPRIAPRPGERFEPMGGTGAYPAFPALPFTFSARMTTSTVDAGLISITVPSVEIGGRQTLTIAGKAPAASDVAARRLWVDILIELEEETVVGGIAFSGYPYLPGVVRDGELSSNYGLPREIRVSWPSSGAFVDADDAVTSQQFTAHSGVHVIACGPVRTRTLLVHLGDFPRLIHGVKQTGFDERFGIVIPWLAVCGYAERVDHDPRAAVGVLAATVTPRVELRDHGMPAPPGTGGTWHADGIYLASSPEPRYVSLTAGSLTGPRRSFVAAEGVDPFAECFISPVLEPGETLRLYLEQSAEHPRTLAGLRFRFRSVALTGILKNPKRMEVEIAAFDPPAGVSPLALDVEQDARYFRSLFDDLVGPGGQADKTCRFVRPVNGRYLLLSLTNASSVRAQIALESLEALQSTHVVVAPRATRSQHISALHYRIVGPMLADDYATLGDAAFGFAVEHLVAGEPQRQLFSTRSLSDLLRHGSARLFANHRYLETTVDVSEERATTHDDSFDEHHSMAWSKGWRRSESGDGVQWAREDAASLRPGYDPGEKLAFATLGNAEIRSHVDTLGHEGLGVFFDQLRQIINTLAGNNPFFTDPNFWPDPSRGPRLLRQDPLNPDGVHWENDVWRGMPGVGRVGLMNHLTLPPFLAAPEDLARLANTFTQKLTEWARNPLAFPDGPPLQDLIGGLHGALTAAGVFTLGPLGPAVTQLLNGLSLSLSGGVSYIGGISLSGAGSPLLPGLSHSASAGVTGSITKQASHTGYSYGQSLTKGHDATTVRVGHTDGLMHRTVTRHLNKPGTVRERKTGGEVRWQGAYADIVTGTLPINITLPGTAGVYRTVDEAVRVRFNGPMTPDVRMDVWFDVTEEVIRDDR